jgi:hypothetical protein
MSDWFLKMILSEGTVAAKCVSGALPNDAVLVSVTRPNGFTIEMQFVSETFDDIAEGEEIPFLTPTFEQIEGTN